MSRIEASGSQFEDTWLETWLRLPRLPLMRDQFPLLGEGRMAEWFNASFIHARIRDCRPVDFIYQGGSEPGTPRNVFPVSLFTVPKDLAKPDLLREPAYLLAHCLTRNTARTFRLDRIQIV